MMVVGVAFGARLDRLLVEVLDESLDDSMMLEAVMDKQMSSLAFFIATKKMAVELDELDDF